MIYISHRGNIDHVDKTQENKKYYIQEAIDLGYDVEIDVRKKRNGSLWLGHDECDSCLLQFVFYIKVLQISQSGKCHTAVHTFF